MVVVVLVLEQIVVMVVVVMVMVVVVVESGEKCDCISKDSGDNAMLLILVRVSMLSL